MKMMPVSIALLLFLSLLSPVVLTQDYIWAPDFPEGATIPLLEAPDQNGNMQNLASLSGSKGLILLFNRSFDWCPYCKAQLINLVAVADDMKRSGFNVATLTYDPVTTLKLVEEDQDITFPLLHDEAIRHVNAYGILNTDYEPGHFAYGVPQPGIMVISPDGVILKKLAEENFRMRPDFADVLEALADL